MSNCKQIALRSEKWLIHAHIYVNSLKACIARKWPIINILQSNIKTMTKPIALCKVFIIINIGQKIAVHDILTQLVDHSLQGTNIMTYSALATLMLLFVC